MVTYEDITSGKSLVAVIGLGYVGLPLAVALAKKMPVIGFDISSPRIEELKSGQDHTKEVSPDKLRNSTAHFTANPADIAKAGVIIVAVPTPIDAHKSPDLTPVIKASQTVGKHMSKGCVVVYESTVYPGVTEDICVPILEEESGLTFGKDFTVGYSPERINPGDKVHTLETIIKVVSGSDAPTADLLEKVYGAVVTAGIHKAASIKVAEAAKVIENTQRDLNIALMNELAIIFNHMGIDTLDVLEAAGTKWNFLKFTPGLVGGHCIGVDPYYLTFKAQEMGYMPRVILAGRHINDSMGKYIAETTVKKLIQSGCRIKGANVAVLGFTFKENVPDLRNTKVVDIIRELKEYGVTPMAYDPEASCAEAEHEYGVSLMPLADIKEIDAVILAVPHEEIKQLSPSEIFKRTNKGHTPVCVDVKGIWDKKFATEAGFEYWRL